MNDAEGISEVCWEDFWDKTIEQLIEDGSLGFEGDRGPRSATGRSTTRGGCSSTSAPPGWMV